MGVSLRRVGAALAIVLASVAGEVGVAHATTPPATPRPHCGPGARPEPGMQGRVPASAVNSGQATPGYWCHVKLVGHEGASGGFKVLRFIDKAGHECAFYDTTLLFPLNAQNLGDHPTGVAVLDMSSTANPVRTTTLLTPAMQTPHESLNLNTKRGLLVAVTGNPITYPGVIDVYDVSQDCRHPALQSSLPVGFVGHESGFAPDGRTFYSTSLYDGHVTAVDLTNPKLPVPLTVFNSPSHGMTVSQDGTRGYIAARAVGLSIVDLSAIQLRELNPQVHEISHLTWDTMSIPQVAIPVAIGGHNFLVEIDEFSVAKRGDPFPAANGPLIGAGRIIDIQNEKKPKVISDFRLQVNQPENRAKVAGDPGATSFVQGYGGHYCSVPQRVNPGIVACSFILSGLRVFDIRDPYHPKELAYFVAPPKPSPVMGEKTDYAMSAPAFAPARGEIWYSDGDSGFYALRVTNGVWPFGGTGCKRRTTVDFRLHRVPGTRVTRVEAFVNGKRRLVEKGHDIQKITLSRLPATGPLTVRIVATHSGGAKVVSTRTWHGCKKGPPHMTVIPRPHRS